ncbi:MAG: tetratricopeptide repeat protein [Verrucomicrobiota bacterium]
MTSRARLYGIVAACAVIAAGLTVGITLATRTPTPKRAVGQAGSPPLVLDLGVRTDPEAVALRRAASLYDAGKQARAARIFDRYGSVDARVGAALASWPGGFTRLAALARDHPGSAVAQLHYGLGLYWRGDVPAAKTAWQAARTAEPDTSYAIRAEDLLYPRFPRGLPTFVPSFAAPSVLDRLSPPQQFAYLRRLAASDGERGKLLYGSALQRLGRQVSALREFEAAAALSPRDPEPQVAAAVARFDKANPSTTFSQLGPLARRYPRSQTVRFHLGLCLLWLADVTQARKELRLARALGPRTQLGVEARKFLDQLAGVTTR